MSASVKGYEDGWRDAMIRAAHEVFLLRGEILPGNSAWGEGYQEGQIDFGREIEDRLMALPRAEARQRMVFTGDTMKRYWKATSAKPDGERMVVTTSYRYCESSPGPQWEPADDEVECIDGNWYIGPKAKTSTARDSSGYAWCDRCRSYHPDTTPHVEQQPGRSCEGACRDDGRYNPDGPCPTCPSPIQREGGG